MPALPYNLGIAVTAVFFAFVSQPLHGEEETRLLLRELRSADAATAQKIAKDIELQWQRSGSATADFLLKRGWDAMERGAFQAAIEHFTALTDHAPEFAEGWVGRAGAFAQQERFGLAISDLEHALALNPQHFEAIFGLGLIFEMLGRPKEAYEAMLILQSIHPHYPDLTDTLNRLKPLAMGQSL